MTNCTVANAGVPCLSLAKHNKRLQHLLDDYSEDEYPANQGMNNSREQCHLGYNPLEKAKWVQSQVQSQAVLWP